MMVVALDDDTKSNAEGFGLPAFRMDVAVGAGGGQLGRAEPGLAPLYSLPPPLPLLPTAAYFCLLLPLLPLPTAAEISCCIPLATTSEPHPATLLYFGGVPAAALQPARTPRWSPDPCMACLGARRSRTARRTWAATTRCRR